MPETCTTDFEVFDGGSIILLRPVSKDANEWIEHYLPQNVLWMGDAFPIERKYWPPIHEGIQEHGLTIS